jgi:hypothetical protein
MSSTRAIDHDRVKHSSFPNTIRDGKHRSET